jgi:hypothetical protein
MNFIQILSSQSWVERLGWTLVYFLWQGLLIAILYTAARQGMARMSSANSRYLLACAALAAMLAAPLFTWGLMDPSGASPDDAYRIRSTPPAAPTTGVTITTLPTSVRHQSVGRKAGTFPVLGSHCLVCWRGGVLVAACGGLDGCRADAVDNGSKCTA